MVQWLATPSSSGDPGLNLNSQTVYYDSLVSPNKSGDSTMKQAISISFHIFFTS